MQGTDGTRLSYAYDEHNNIQSYAAKKNGTTLSAASYTYTDAGLPVSAELNAEFSDYSHSYDSLNRLTELTHDVNGDTVRTIYTYKDGTEDGTTTGQVNYVSYRYGYYSFGPYPDQYYSYDANGNIVETSNGAMQIFYTYDALNRLVREDNELLNKSFTYEYDVGGNILNKKEYAYTTEELGTPTDTIVYTYDSTWKDKLLTYDGGETITYDNIGNPLTYNGYTFTWQKGRQLASASGNGDTITYKYGADGLRTQKTVNDVTTEYTYASGLLVSQTDGTNTLNFAYTADGVPRSVNYNGTDYYYLYNLQGDVVVIYDRGGNPMVHYTYDTWGKVVNITGTLKNTLGTLNPFRYRGYYYDTETGFYYLTTRYYDPDTGRFLNADRYISTAQGHAGYNMFSYCNNNPIKLCDSTGSLAGLIALGVIGFAGIVGLIWGLCSDEKLAEKTSKNNDTMNGSTKLPNPLAQQPGYSNDSPNKQSTGKENSVTKTNEIANEVKSVELSTFDKAVNAGIGLGLGLVTAGAVLAIVGATMVVVPTMVVAPAAVTITTIGFQIAASGILAINIPAMIIFPAVDIAIEPIEWTGQN